MKILFLAPHPFYQERGTPIAVDLLLRSLSEQGHEVDVITFAEGEERNYPNVRLFRVNGLGLASDIRPGFSIKKLYLDLFLLLRFVWMLFSRRYDVVHAVEESAFMASVFCPIRRVPYIYDMDSSMVTQIVDKIPKLAWAEKMLRFLESIPARYASVVVPCCDALANDTVSLRSDGMASIRVLKDISLLDKSRSDTKSGLVLERAVSEFCERSGRSSDDAKLLMYIGNLESYQGIDLMLDAFAIAMKADESLILIIVGGEDEHIAIYQDKCEQLNCADSVLFLGKQPVADLYALMHQAHLLMSPRTQGVNTPMKVYSYLDSGVPVLATRLSTHTQVMSDENSFLVDPTPESMGGGIVEVMADKSKQESLAEAAAKLIQREHSWKAFNDKVADIYSLLD